MPTLRIVHASPLILLTKIGRIDLLNAAGVDVLVPMPVLQEGSALDNRRKSVAGKSAGTASARRRGTGRYPRHNVRSGRRVCTPIPVWVRARGSRSAPRSTQPVER